jgi:hypothetical protein
MLAYIFWHRPYGVHSQSLYESALLEFHQQLAEASLPGCKASAAYRISPTPWLGEREGYEDWYLVDGSWALDPLNHGAVSGRMESPHAAIAALMETGYGGLYSLVWGEPAHPPRSRVAWLSRPRGIRYEPVLAELRDRLGGQLSCWRRQMVLSPAPEFALVGIPSLDPDLPPAWQGRLVERVCIWPTPETGRSGKTT